MSKAGESRDPVAEQLASFGLRPESRLYRHTRPEFLEPLDEPGTYRISANADPSEAVVDVYAGGHTTLAVHMGPGLAFAEAADNEWRESGRAGVELLLREGLISESEIPDHPMRNFVECCLGGDPRLPSMSITGQKQLQPGDTLVACTDGLWSGLGDEEIVSALGNGKVLYDGLRALGQRLLVPRGQAHRLGS